MKINTQSVVKTIEKNGFCVIKNFLKKNFVQKLLFEVNNYYKKNLTLRYSGVPKRDSKDKILYNLQNKNHNFIKILTYKPAVEIAKYFLDDKYYRFLPNKYPNYILNYFNARSSGKKLDLHIDSWIPYKGKKTHMMQFVYLLEDSTQLNGCTTVVKGSHRSGSFTDRKSKKIISVTGKAGDLIIWDSRIWHGTLENLDGTSRWAIVATLSSWWIKQAMDMPKSLPKSIYQKCTNQQKQLLGFCSIPPVNEYDRINTKCGYEILKK